MTDTVTSLAILGGCAVAGWWFFRWDQRMILRDRQELDGELSDSGEAE